MLIREASNARLWQLSETVYPNKGLTAFLQRLRYVARARKVGPVLERLTTAGSESPLGFCMNQRPEIAGLVEAPYLNAQWSPAVRIEAFVRQFDLARRLGSAFSFEVTQSINFPTISDLGENYTVVMDKPVWFQREGILTLNIFRINTRLISLSFSVDEIGGRRVVIIGAVQGRKLDNIMEEYRHLTRLAHGLRPRDLLIECLRVIATSICAERLLAVSDENRHHRHSYFGRDARRQLPLDYNEIWRDRGGFESGDGFFELPLIRPLRAVEEIPAKKRAMYRKRDRLLSEIDQKFRAALPALQPVKRAEAL